MIESYFEKKRHLIDDALLEILEPIKNKNHLLYEATKYSLNNGKRLRPILLLAIVDMLNGDEKKAILPAVCLELIHTYSLIHDDLPCMDDDDIRRGMPSVHKKYPEWLAVLTGDFLLTYSFEILSTDQELDSDTKLKLIELFSKYSGSDGMIIGQVMDLHFKDKKINWDVLSELHIKKTASLMLAAVEASTIILNCKKETIMSLKGFGKAFGLAYQIIDDIIDEKHKSNDEVNTINLLGKEKAKEMVFSLQKEAKTHLYSISEDPKILLNICDKVTKPILAF